MFRTVADAAVAFSLMYLLGVLPSATTSTASSPADDQELRLLTGSNFTKTWTVGRTGEFVNPVAILPGADGTLYVGDRGAHAVLVIDSTGKVVKRFGRRGQGPGDFIEIAGMVWMHDTLVVLDSRNRRLSKFSSDGRLLGTVGIQLEGGLAELHRFGSGELVVVTNVRPPLPDQKKVIPSTPPPQPRRHFWRHSGSGSFTEMSWANDASPTYWNSNCETADGWIRSVTHPFAHVGRLHAFVSDFLVLAAGNRSILTSANGAIRQVRLPLTPKPINAKQWANLTSGFQVLERNHGSAICNFIPAPASHFPMVRTLLESDVDVVWMAIDAMEGEGWLIWSPRSTLAHFVQMQHPRERIVAAARDGKFYSVRPDDDFGYVIDSYRLSERQVR